MLPDIVGNLQLPALLAYKVGSHDGPAYPFCFMAAHFNASLTGLSRGGFPSQPLRCGT